MLLEGIANTHNLGIKNKKINLGKNGEIIVNQNSQTSVKNVFAIGDVTDRLNLTPVAIAEGEPLQKTNLMGKI